jgi:putative membrane protein
MDKNLKTALIVGGIAFAVLIIVPSVIGAFFGWQGSGWGMMGPAMMGGTMGFMGIAWAVILGLIIWAVVAAVRGTSPQSGSGGQPESALEILKKRYARGEIDKVEFEAKKKDLT